MHHYKKLEVWQKSVEFVATVYQVTATFPGDERFGLIAQMRRCAVSIPSNVAEGAGRNSDQEFRQFLSIALGSSFELETQILVSERLGLLSKDASLELLESLNSMSKMLVALRRSIGRAQHEE